MQNKKQLLKILNALMEDINNDRVHELIIIRTYTLNNGMHAIHPGISYARVAEITARIYETSNYLACNGYAMP